VQLDTGPVRRSAGTGLGLSICKDVVELMGGQLRVSSEPGRGSRFWFDVYFPRAEALPLAPAVAAAATSNAGRRLRIMVVDDNVTNLHLLREILEQDGHDVSIAESGQGALDLLATAEQAPDVIFLDYNLGDMDGIQVLQVYHFGVRDPAPVFFLTADTSADTTARLRDTDACGIIGKPVRLAEIREVLADTFPEGRRCRDQDPIRGCARCPSFTSTSEVLAEVAAISKRPEFLGEMIDHAVRDIERSNGGPDCRAGRRAVGRGQEAGARPEGRRPSDGCVSPQEHRDLDHADGHCGAGGDADQARDGNLRRQRQQHCGAA
jgi:CheY-like chemotaxis protein